MPVSSEPAVLNLRALFPIAVFLMPVVFLERAACPKAVLDCPQLVSPPNISRRPAIMATLRYLLFMAASGQLRGCLSRVDRKKVVSVLLYGIANIVRRNHAVTPPRNDEVTPLKGMRI
jgi:hypothetical protein